MVDVTKPIVNPRLSEALAALHRENTPANQDRALRELMTQAHLLAPVVLTPAPPPAVSGQTTLEQNTAIQFQLISSQEGRPFFPAFTNWGELRKLCGPRDQQTLVLTFDDYASMLQRDSRAAGFVVDPFGDSLTLDRETVARLARQKAEGTPPVRQVIQKDTRVMLGDPAEYPERMVEAICSAARELPAVKALYLRLMVREGEMEPSYLVVVDQDGEQDAVFSAIAGAARPWLDGKTVDLVPRSSRFGQDASKGVSPFYDRI